MSKPERNVAKKILDELRRCLSTDKTEQILHIFEDVNETVLNELSCEIVPLVSSYLTIENKLRNPELIECCETILDRISEKCNPLEVVLQLLEQVEYLEDDLKFCTILKPLSKTLQNMPDKTKAIEWCMSTIRWYVESLPSKQEIIHDEDDEPQDIEQYSSRIENIYDSILLLFMPLIDEAALETNEYGGISILRNYLLSVLIFLLGKPLCYMEKMEYKLADCKVSMPVFIIRQVARMKGDLLWFLKFIDARGIRPNKMRSIADEECLNLEVLLFESCENIPQLAYANFYFYILTTPLWENIPQVYSPEYIFHVSLYLVNCLLKEVSNVLVTKGLGLMQTVLQRINKKSFTLDILELNIYSDILSTITKLMLYCNNKKIRQCALHIFQGYLEIFNMEAKYYIVVHLYKTSEHSELSRLTTGIVKTSIIECLQTTPPSPYFLGNNLETLLNQTCKLPHGSASDLVELTDEVITSLNLLRFLFIRDKNNETGIWNLLEALKNNYLNPLREGIDLCKAHWKVKIKDLEEQKKTCVKKYGNVQLEKVDADVMLTVGGEKVPAMPIAEKIAFCHQAVNGLDVMESILIRVNECIADHSSGQPESNTA